MTDTRQVSFNRTKIGEKCQKFKCDILSNFQTMCYWSDYLAELFDETKSGNWIVTIVSPVNLNVRNLRMFILLLLCVLDLASGIGVEEIVTNNPKLSAR